MVMKVKGKLMATLSLIKDHVVISSHNVLSAIDTAILRSTDSSDAPLGDDKHVREILFIISNAPGSITFLARRITDRLELRKDPIVPLKTLLLLHRLLRGGDRYFEQDLRNLWSSGELRIDLSWMIGDPNPLCGFAFKYSRFLEERMEWMINQAGKLEPVKPVSGSGAQSYEEEEMEVTLYRISKSQALFDRIMECHLPISSFSLIHAVQSAMNVVLRESFRVYESFNEGVEVVLGSFSDLKKHTRVLSIDVLRKACAQSRKLHEFYEDCKNICVVGKSLDYPLVRIIMSEEISSMDSMMTVTKDEELREESHETSVSPFSDQKLETKISTVWVEFDEEDSQSGSSLSLEDEVSIVAERQSSKTWNKTTDLL